MKKTTLTFFIIICTISMRAQIIDIDYSKEQQKVIPSSKKPEFLKNGFLDFLSDGNVQASARLLKLNIGEPNRFQLPLYIYTGASGKTFGENKLNQTTISNLLNPICGTINISFNGLNDLIIFNSNNLTKLRFAYQFGGRMLSGTDSIKNENINFFNILGNVGLFFQTGAWDEENTDNMGVFFIQLKGTFTGSAKSDLQTIFGSDIESSYFVGYAMDAGIEINQVIDFKLSIFQYLNNHTISALNEPIVKLSLDYSFGK